MFRDGPIQYPDKNPVSDRYLGSAIDDGPEMTEKTTKINGEVVHWSIYHEVKE